MKNSTRPRTKRSGQGKKKKLRRMKKVGDMIIDQLKAAKADEKAAKKLRKMKKQARKEKKKEEK